MQGDWFIKIVPSWEKGHARVMAGVRFACGCWLLVLTAILHGYRRAGWWTPLLVVAAAAHFYYAHRLRRLSGAGKPSGDAA